MQFQQKTSNLVEIQNDNYVHKEAILTKEFGKYLLSQYKYHELFEDKNTSGSDPFDSIGIIDDNLILIEYKTSISPGQVFYNGSKGSSIEKKIGTVLNLIYSRQNSKTYNSVRDYISETTIPLIWIVANNLSKATVENLEILLLKRCIEWQFHYKVSTWKKEREEVLLSSTVPIPEIICHEEIQIPAFPSTAKKRRAKLSKEKLKDEFRRIELGSIYEELLDVFREFKLKPTYNITNVNFNPLSGGYALFGIWPKKSNKRKGVLLTLSLEKINDYFGTNLTSVNELGLVRNTLKIGNLGFNSYVNSKSTVQEIKKRIKKASNNR